MQHREGDAQPSFTTLLTTQFLDGFGGRFHGVLLSLYAMRLEGLSGFASMTAVGMIGMVASTFVAGWLTSRLGGRRTMAFSAATLAGSRVVTYGAIALGVGFLPLVALRLVGTVSATLMMNAAKAQAPSGAKAASTLAWMNVTNGLGQAVATACAGLLALAPTWLIAVVGAPMAALPTLPMIRLARYATAQAVPFAAQWSALKTVAPAALLGAAVQLCGSGLVALRDGLTVDLYSEHWLGAVTFASLVGSFVGAAVLPRLSRVQLNPSADLVVWPILGAAGVLGWAFAADGVVWLIGCQLVAGLSGQLLGAFSEARVLEGAGRRHALPALTAAGAMASFAGALSTLAMPPLLKHLGYGPTALLTALPLIALACFGLGRGLRQSGVLMPGEVAPEPVPIRSPDR